MWVYLPFESDRCVRGSVHSILPPASLYLDLERCLWWRGKPSAASLWRTRWKRESWIRRLCSRISAASMAAPGLEAWISSCRESHASPTPEQGNGAATMTNGRSGPSSFESWLSAARERCSSRTRQISSSTPSPSGESFEDWASSGRRPGYRLPRSTGRRTTESESFSSLPTPTAASYGTQQGGGQGRTGPARPSLETLVRGLPTPTARDWKSGKASDATHERNSRPLNEVVERLPTPTAEDARMSGAAGYSTSSGRHSGTTFTDAIVGAASAGRTGKPSPRLREWMMGLPIGLTERGRPE